MSDTGELVVLLWLLVAAVVLVGIPALIVDVAGELRRWWRGGRR